MEFGPISGPKSPQNLTKTGPFSVPNQLKIRQVWILNRISAQNRPIPGDLGRESLKVANSGPKIRFRPRTTNTVQGIPVPFRAWNSPKNHKIGQIWAISGPFRTELVRKKPWGRSQEEDLKDPSDPESGPRSRVPKVHCTPALAPGSLSTLAREEADFENKTETSIEHIRSRVSALENDIITHREILRDDATTIDNQAWTLSCVIERTKTERDLS